MTSFQDQSTPHLSAAPLSKFLNGRTPVSALQEYCMKHKTSKIEYTVVTNEGPVHEPIFIIRATVGDCKAEGSGSSKKKAKHNAASKLLCIMMTLTDDTDTAPISSPSQVTSSTPYSDSRDETAAMEENGDGGNPVGELQEFTQKNTLKPPLYQFVSEQGPPHQRQFVCTIKLNKLQETAIGKSKKLAKRNAAAKMLNAIRQYSNSSQTLLDDDEDNDTSYLALNVANASNVNLNNVHTLTDEGARMARNFFEKLRMTGSSIPDQMFNDNPKAKLDLMAKEKKFELTYLDLKEKSHSGHFQCLLQIGVQPIAVCMGHGMTINDAHMSAAYNAIQYLKVMTAMT